MMMMKNLTKSILKNCSITLDFDDFSTENDEEAQNLDYQYLAPKGRSVFKKVKTK